MVIGGDSPQDMTVRAITYLMCNPMQMVFNRTGSRGKLNFSEVLEPLIKGKDSVEILLEIMVLFG